MAENSHGVVNTLYRKFRLTPQQAVEEYGRDNLPPKIVDDFDKGKYDSEYWFIHAVIPQSEADEKLPPGMQYASYHVSIEDKRLVKPVSGYFTFPYAVGRYETEPGETYGRGPGVTALADIKTINKMSKMNMIAGDMAVHPPLLAGDADNMTGTKLVPGGITYGGVNAEGRPMVQPLAIGGNLPISLEMEQQRRQIINDAFLVTLFDILVQEPNMTATEALLRAQERGILLAPTLGRLQAEMIGPTIERELDILSRAGLLPDPPEELMQGGGLTLNIEYDASINRLARSEEATAIMNTLQMVMPLAQFDQSLPKIFKFPDMVRELAEINGMPVKLLHSEEEMQEIQEQEAQMQAMQAAVAAAPAVTQSVKNVADAGKAEADAAAAQAQAEGGGNAAAV